jgi:hypothetical protein
MTEQQNGFNKVMETRNEQINEATKSFVSDQRDNKEAMAALRADYEARLQTLRSDFEGRLAQANAVSDKLLSASQERCRSTNIICACVHTHSTSIHTCTNTHTHTHTHTHAHTGTKTKSTGRSKLS